MKLHLLALGRGYSSRVGSLSTLLTRICGRKREGPRDTGRGKKRLKREGGWVERYCIIM